MKPIKKIDEDKYIPKYSIIITFFNGSRGYVIEAEDKKSALERLMDHIGAKNLDGMEGIQISEILLDEDIVF